MPARRKPSPGELSSGKKTSRDKIDPAPTFPMSDSQPTKHAVFSFFSGAGFLDLGFEAAGFETVFANEINADFVEGYKYSRLKMGLSVPRYGVACDSIDDHLDDEVHLHPYEAGRISVAEGFGLACFPRTQSKETLN